MGVFMKMIFIAPCIWPIINSLSNLSVPASSRSLPPFPSKNFLLRPLNQFSQNDCVARRSVRHVHGRGSAGVEWSGFLSSRSKDGTVTQAEVALRMVRDRMLHQY